MRYWILLVLLLLPVGVGAGEWLPSPYRSPSPTCKIWWKSTGDGNVTHQTICDGDEPVSAKEIQCYTKMREAMVEANLYLNQKAGIVHYDKDGKLYAMPDPNFVKDWNQIMRECVQ